MSVHGEGQEIRTSLEDSDSVPSSYVIKDKEDRSWKAYFSETASSSILQPGEDCTVGSFGFLYDYYGMTEDTQHGPPSPPTSDPTAVPTTSPSKLTEKELNIVTKITSEQHDSEDDHSGSSGSPAQGQPCNTSVNATQDSPESPEARQLVSTQIKSESYVPVSSLQSAMAAHYAAVKQSNAVFQIEDKFAYILKAQTSSIQKQGDDSLTYLNKGQFYTLTFESNLPQGCSLGCIKSILHLVFHGEKDPKIELANWQYWHSQQANPSQRAFDVDRKACKNIEEVDFVGYNAVAFSWNTQSKAEVVIRVNCLSTDFSSQKGVKGIPLHFQIDTYEEPFDRSVEPIHRAFCQVKIFRDKGAERKNKDESKSAEKRMVKFMKQNSVTGVPVSKFNNIFQCPSKVTKLIPTTPLGQKPAIFIPNVQTVSCELPARSGAVPSLLAQLREKETKRTMTAALTIAKEDFQDLSVLPKYKNPRVTKKQTPAVTIYVRKSEEKVYNALMLFELEVNELKDALASKYSIPAEMIKNVYKKTRKGFLVNLDDNMIAQFVDEDDFLIEVSFDNQLGHFEITFIY